MIPRDNLDNAIVESAKLAFDHAWRGVFEEQPTAHIISLALVPTFGVGWSRKSIAAVDTRPVNRRVN